MKLNGILLISLFLLVHCAEKSTPSSPFDSELLLTHEWRQIALADTLVFELDIFESESFHGLESFIAFTGLEVFVGNSERTIEYEGLRNRSVYVFDLDSYNMFSADDSTWITTSVFNVNYKSLNIPPTKGKSIYWDDKLYYISKANQLLAFDIDSQDLDTLISIANTNLRLLSNSADILFIKSGDILTNYYINNPMDGLLVSSLPVSSITATTIAENGTQFVGTQTSKLFKSIDNGANWVETWPEFIPSNPVTDIEIGKSGEVYMSILGSGIFFSEDNGDSWEAVNQLDLNIEIYSLEDSYFFGLLAATNDGIYQLTEVE